MFIDSHVLDVFSVLSDRIKSIPFHERSASHGTSLEYQQQGNRSNLKIHLGGLKGKKFGKKKYVLGILKL